jgi:hypothetical protein
MGKDRIHRIQNGQQFWCKYAKYIRIRNELMSSDNCGSELRGAKLGSFQHSPTGQSQQDRNRQMIKDSGNDEKKG